MFGDWIDEEDAIGAEFDAGPGVAHVTFGPARFSMPIHRWWRFIESEHWRLAEWERNHRIAAAVRLGRKKGPH